MKTKARFYFYNRDGKTELESPLNGSVPTWCGAGVDVDGNMADKTTADVWRDGKGRIARKEIGVREGGEERLITAADFGVTAVLVKEWFPGYVDWFWLVDDAAAEKIGNSK